MLSSDGRALIQLQGEDSDTQLGGGGDGGLADVKGEAGHSALQAKARAWDSCLRLDAKSKVQQL